MNYGGGGGDERSIHSSKIERTPVWHSSYGGGSFQQHQSQHHGNQSAHKQDPNTPHSWVYWSSYQSKEDVTTPHSWYN